MKNRVLIAANWKMNKGIEESLDFLSAFSALLETSRSTVGLIPEKLEISIFPPIASLYLMKNKEHKGHLAFGVQNIHWKESGAFTGENSVSMALEAGAVYALVGHSERRHLFGEDDETIGKKFDSCVKMGLQPVLCVGETDDERKKGLTGSVVERQVEKALHSYPIEHFEKRKPLIIAYEPVWAIGTGITATAEDAQRSCSVIRTLVGKIFDAETAEETALLYGGSVNASNALDFLKQKDIDGLLVGGASLDPEKFFGIIRVAASLFRNI